jgi:Putative Flp pilus-assembly TadE/G-like
MTTFARQTGQATVMTVLFLSVLLAMAGAVLDVGVWFNEDRKLQATTDAAALAAAQELPDSTALATSRALEYGDKNGGGVDSDDITYETTVLPSDTVLVETERDAPGIFTRLLGVESVEVHATAKARTGTLSTARWVAPIVVNWQHPMLQCTPPPCAGATQIDLMDLHSPGGGDAAGAFGLINLNRSDANGNVGASTLADWMLTGFSGEMGLGNYWQAPSTNFNNGQFQNALRDRLNTEILFPIYRTISGPGSNARYDIIGWVGFVPTSFHAGGSTGTVRGEFVRVLWEGLPSSNPSQPSFGAYTVSLVE